MSTGRFTLDLFFVFGEACSRRGAGEGGARRALAGEGASET